MTERSSILDLVFIRVCSAVRTVSGFLIVT